MSGAATASGRARPAGIVVLGIVGRIGAGKSTVSRMFGDAGAVVVDADRIAHEVLRGDEARRAVREVFGEGVIDAAGQVDRGRLAARVFGPTAAHAAALADLEAIVHPRVHARIAEALERAAEAAPPRPVVVLDVPLLLQSGWGDACDWVVVIECDDAVRRARAAARFSPEQIAAREAAWNRRPPGDPPPGRTRRVDTSRDLPYTRAQVERIWSEVVRPADVDGPRSGDAAGSAG